MSASVSTHVLDVERGRPAIGVHVELYRGVDSVGAADTDDDGRISSLATDLEPGAYRLVFAPDSPFFRRVELLVARALEPVLEHSEDLRLRAAVDEDDKTEAELLLVDLVQVRELGQHCRIGVVALLGRRAR